MNKLTIESLQEKINYKADQRARAFVKLLTDAIHSSGLLDLKDFRVVNKNTDYDDTMRSTLWELDLSQKKKKPLSLLYKVKYEQFIKEETKLFVDNVNKLVSQTDDLLNIANNQ